MAQVVRILIMCTLPERQAYYDYLKKKLPTAEFIFDKHKQAMDTFLRTLRHAQNEAVVIMEDDTILTQDFTQKLEAVIKEHPSDVINFFSRRKDDERIGSRYIHGSAYSSNCCFYIPHGFANSLLKFSETWIPENRKEHPTGTDFLVAAFLKANKMKYWNHVPSLVQHREGLSVINSKRNRSRISKTFCHPDT